MSSIPPAQEIQRSALLPHPGWLTGAALNTVVFTLGYKVLRKGLTPLGVANAWLLGASIFSAFGLGGYSLVCLYFIFGTLVRSEGARALPGAYLSFRRRTRHADAPWCHGSRSRRWCWQVTKVKLEQKQREGIAEARSGQRSPVRSVVFAHASARGSTGRHGA